MSSLANQPQPLETNTSFGKSWLAQDSANFQSVLLHQCYQGVSDLHTALQLLDEAGTRLTESLLKGLEQTSYRSIGDLIGSKLREVYISAASKTNLAVQQEMESILAGVLNSETLQTDPHVCGQTLCHVALLLAKMNKQYYSMCHSQIDDFVKALLCLKGEDPASGEITKLVLKLGLADGQDSPLKSNTFVQNTPWGSPKLRKSPQDSDKAQSRAGFRIMSLFERKTSPDERKSSFNVEEKRSEEIEPKREGIPTVSVTAGSHGDTTFVPSHTSQVFDPYSGSILGTHPSHIPDIGRSEVHQFPPIIEDPLVKRGTSVPVILSSRSQLVSEEELESVINLLSGVGCGSVSPMQVIPEVVPPQGSMQLTVPQVYRTLSPVSDTHLEEHRKSQVHRRSEGCLDLSAMGRNIWPHQHQYHHRASLPSVQIFSASGHRSVYDPPSPVPPYIRDSPSPNYGIRDPPSPGYFRGDPPSPFRAHYAKTLGINMGAVRPNMLSPLQWSAYSPGSHASSRMSGLDPNVPQHGTWPMYGGGISSVSPSVAETGSWMGTHDCSDLSDDSSTEDQFFAVGKDLSHMISSKDGSSDEEVEGGQLDIPKSSSPWPPPNFPHGGPAHMSRGLTPELLEPPEVYNLHKPVQIQWSDPLSSRSVWQPAPQDSTNNKTSQSMQTFGGPP